MLKDPALLQAISAAKTQSDEAAAPDGAGEAGE